MKSLVLAEKPSVAREIARVLQCNAKNKNYIEGPAYVGLGTSCYASRTRRLQQEI